MYLKCEGIQSRFSTGNLIVLLCVVTSQRQHLALWKARCMACTAHELTSCCMLEYVVSVPGIDIVPYLEDVCPV